MAASSLHLVIANPRAGGGKAAHVAERIAALAKEAGHACEVALTQRPGHATRIAAEAAPSAAAVLALGGDGTVHEVANGILEAAEAAGGDPSRVAALGTVPLGTGNDFLKSLGLPRDPIAAYLAIRGGKRRRIDAGRVRAALEVPARETVRALLAGPPGPPSEARAEWFVNDFSAGLGANTIVTMMNPPLLLRILPARLAYMIAGMLNGAVPAAPLAVTVDGARSPRERFHEVHVGNGRFCGGGAQFTPRAEIDDGRLDVAAFHSVGRLRNFWTMLTQVQGGTTRQGAGVDVATARRVEVESARPLAIYLDGDLRIARGKVEIECVPGALEVLVGARSEGA